MIWRVDQRMEAVSDPDSRLPLAGLSGIASIILSLGGFGLIGAAGFAVQEGTIEEVSEIVSKTPPGQVLLGVSIDMIGSVFFVLFVAGLWARLRRWENSPAWLSAAALAAGILAVAASLIDKTLFFSLYSLSGEGLGAETARVLFLTARASFLLFGLFAGAMAGIAGVAIFRYRSFGVWLGWLGALAGVAGIASVLAPDSPVGQVPFFLVVIWIVAASLSLLRGRKASSQ
jgi:hypothetical protein